MKMLIVVSPDKVSLNMFFSFLNRYYQGQEIEKPLAVNSLTSAHRNDEILKEYIGPEESNKILIVLYKTMRQTPLEDLSCLRSDLYEQTATIVFALDLYSTTPRVLKDQFDESGTILDNWKIFVDKVEKGI